MTFLPQEIIRKKRSRQTLTGEEIGFFVKGITDGSIADAQTAALTMAIFLNGFSRDETVALTLNMRDSGDVLQWPDIDGPVVDKHSSGGVGDKVSLMLAPMIAACGGFVPMISGRGLGHTGGTLDKFDSIPGYQTTPDNDRFRQTVREVGCAIIGQTGNLAPADKKIYAIRDVCGTVESVELITASILSKKLAAGLNCLVMDLKCGNGAFMDNLDDARRLAESIVTVANGAGTKTSAVLTDMNQVLGRTAGNAVEVAEAVAYLKEQNVDSRLHKVTMALCAELLVSAKLAKDKTEAENKLTKALSSGRALEIFARMVAALGGPVDFCDYPDRYLPRAPVVKPLYAEKDGWIASMQTRNIGLSIIGLKGGRITPDQKLDYSTGYTDFCQIGDYVDAHKPLAVIHATDEASWQQAAADLRRSITVSEQKPVKKPVIIEHIA